MSAWRRRLRRLRRWLAFGAASLLILWALLVATASQLLPWVADNPERVAAWLSERAGRPIGFTTSSAYWTRSGPVFVLRELRVGEGEDSLRVGEAELLLRVYSGLVPGNPLTELRIQGAKLELVRQADGRWRAAGLGEGGGGLGQLEALGELRIDGASLMLRDEAEGRELQLENIAVALRSSGGRLRAGALVPLGQGEPLRLAAEFSPESGDGRLWLGGTGLRIGDEFADLGWQGLALQRAEGRLGLWLGVRDGRPDSLQVEAELEPLVLRGTAAVPLDTIEVEPRLGIDRLGLSAHWQARGAGWSLELVRLHIDDGGETERHGPVSLVKDGEGLRLGAASLPLGLAAGLAALSDRLSPTLRGRLYAAMPGGALREAGFAWHGDGTFHGQAGVVDLTWRGGRQYPGLDGLSGQLRGDEAGWLLDLDPESRVQLDWPGGLRQGESLNLSGSLIAFPDGEAWRLAASGLRIAAEDLGIAVEGGIRLAPGLAPELDLAARVDRMPILAAKRFWILNRMPPNTVAWLDRALLEGELVEGLAAMVGSSADWPFAEAQGRFQATARGRGVRMAFHPDWPVAEELEAYVRFENESLHVESARGRLLGVPAAVRGGEIASFKRAGMRLDIAAEGTGPQLLQLLRATPLQRRHGAQMAGLRVGGEADVRVAFYVPFNDAAGEPWIDGVVDLRSADLREDRWQLALDQASGRIRFNQGGFAADGLSVRVDGDVAHLDLAVGGYTADPVLAATAALRGQFPASALLLRAEGLDWLKPHLAGSADWQIELAVPQDGDEAMGLYIRSDLLGATVSLPAPMDKAPDVPLPLDLRLGLPIDRGDIDLRLGERLHLVGRWPAQGPFRGEIVLGGGAAGEPPAQGLRIRGAVASLEAVPWLGLGLGGGGGTLALDGIDVQVETLDLMGRRLGPVGVAVAAAEQGDWLIRFSGEPMQGEVRAPRVMGPEFPVQGRFERFHWPELPDEGEAGPTRLPTVVPASLPPIDFQAEDLRYGLARLGRVRLETYPTLEGMHIERFEASSPELQITAQGDWNLIGGRERSSFGIRFSGEDLGKMLIALGYSVRVDRGRTEAGIEATWPGAPAAFELERLDGTLTLNVGQGRFLDVEPGAGRILGLFSVTEITRRLSLDFRDFFETGLGFNTVTGSFVLDGGNAYTEDLDIDSPSATIRIRGRTGLKTLDYDQTVEVLPRTGGVLPVVGAIAGGPAGAALGAVAQSVLQQPLGQMTRTLYRLSGSWSEPSTEVIERGPARRSAPREEPQR
jgi:uncharacterized protein (TIGR02099 family)